MQPDPGGPAVRVLLTADTHLGFDLPRRPRVDRRRRGVDFFANYTRVIEHALAMRPDLVVHGGDFFARSRVAPAVIDRAYEGLGKLAAAGIPVVVAPGNHERSRLPASLWLRHPLIHVFDRPETFTFAVRGVDVAIAGFPFARGDVRTAFRTLVGSTGWEEARADLCLLCVHQAFDGARVGVPGFVFRDRKDVIRRSDIPSGFAAVLAGHIHRRQILVGDGNPVVIYPGSIERTSFAERGEPKGFFDLRFARNHEQRWGLKRADFVVLPSRPMVDIDIGGVPGAGIEGYLDTWVSQLDREAVVRITGLEAAPRDTQRRVTASYLRARFPPTMNVQLALPRLGGAGRFEEDAGE